jgi:virginiamycin B lyase
LAGSPIVEFTILTSGSGSLDITTGADGNIWFTEQVANKIGRVTPSGAMVEFAIPTLNSNAFGIANGSDGNLWFTEPSVGKIGRLVP